MKNNLWLYERPLKIRKNGVFLFEISLRSKRYRTKRTQFGPRKKRGESKKVEKRRWRRGKKGALARKPSILKNAHWFSRLSSFTDGQLCHRAKITLVLHVSTKPFEGQKVKCLSTRTTSRRLLKFGLSLSEHEKWLSRAKRGCHIRLSKSAGSCWIFAYDQ